MSHEIDQTTGKAAVFVVGDPAWHGLGTVIREAATSAEAIGLAGLDWSVEQWPAHTRDPLGNEIPCPNRVANVRTDTNAVLGIFTPQYRVFQNSEAFDFMDDIVGEKLAMYETAGSLKGGKQVWMLARVPKEYRVGEDVVQPYILLTNSHDGTQALRMIPTTVRVVCNNTLNLAMGAAGRGVGIAISHFPALDTRVKEARKKLGILSDRLDTFGLEMQALADRKMSAMEVKDYFRALFPTQTAEQAEEDRVVKQAALLDTMLDRETEGQEVVEELLESHFARTKIQAKHNQETLDYVLESFEAERNNLPGIERSAWSAYNAVSEWTDHRRTSKGKSQSDRDDNRLKSVWFGGANQIKQTAYQSALDLVGNVG